MSEQEFEELFPIGCVVSHDIKEKISFGKWEEIWIYDFSVKGKVTKGMNNLPPKHLLEVSEVPAHSFGEVVPAKPPITCKFSYKRIG